MTQRCWICGSINGQHRFSFDMNAKERSELKTTIVVEVQSETETV